jgi:hypothetical protein
MSILLCLLLLPTYLTITATATAITAASSASSRSIPLATVGKLALSLLTTHSLLFYTAHCTLRCATTHTHAQQQLLQQKQVTDATGTVAVEGFTAIESGATFHIIPATGDLSATRYYAVRAATAALVWSDPMIVSAAPGSFDSITITSARFKTGDFRVDGTADFDTTPGAAATTITLWQKNNAGALVRVTNGAVAGVGVPLAPIPVGESPFVLWRVTLLFRIYV